MAKQTKLVLVLLLVCQFLICGVSGWRGQVVDVDVVNDDNNTSSYTPTINPHLSTTHIPMSPTLRAQYIFTIHSNSTLFAFDIAPSSSSGDVGSRYLLNVLVERIWCHESENNYLVMEGHGPERNQVTRSLKLCMVQDNSENWWQSVDNVLDDVIKAEVKAEGDWVGLGAQVVVSIYQEVDFGCAYCDLESFCCSEDARKARCIPKSGMCNRHPNCGMYSNKDESEATCSPQRSDCVGTDCHMAEVALRIAVMVVFCFLLPPTLILLACRFGAARRLCDRVNVTVSQYYCGGGREDRNSNNTTLDERRRSAVVVCSHHNNDQGNNTTTTTAPATYNSDEDQPPSYEESFTQSSLSSVSVIPLKEAPPPSFEQAVRHSTGDEEGVVNPAFSEEGEVSEVKR